ncbi:MAG: hypothetical protein IJS46_02545 [Kiritimatiellae bacterium]|nr:hypothetical protein [Kiritimatiellia bacterium]
MNEQSFESVVARLCDPESGFEYDSEAWYFLREGVDRALSATEKPDGSRRHVTAREICESLRDQALEQFGPMSLLVFSQWGIYETADFGRMVGALVGEGVYSRGKGDDEKDFEDVYDFHDAFDAPFLPPSELKDKKRTKK